MKVVCKYCKVRIRKTNCTEPLLTRRERLADRMIGTRQIEMGVDFVLLIILVLTEMSSYALGLKEGFVDATDGIAQISTIFLVWLR